MSDQDDYSPRDYDDQQQTTQQSRGKGERQVPEQVKSFISAMQRRIANRQLYELQSLYSDDLNDLSEKYFKAQPWPTPEKLGLDGTFALVYKELCYRHIYNRLQPTVSDRIESFSTYCALFDAILAMRVDGPELDLPPVWLWDILDEFVYQFESFHQFRARLGSVSPADIEHLKQRPDVWSAPAVLRYLHLIVKKSQLTAAAKPASAAVDADEEESDEDDEGVDDVDEKESDAVGGLFKTLGYLSLVALLRVNCLLGDYNSALKALEPIDLKQKKALFTQLPNCHATMYYFMGFAYLMLRRYVDAVKVFSSFLQFVQRNKQLARKYMQSAVQKRVDKIYGLLSIVFSCTSQRLDEMLHNALKEKSGDRMQRMQKGELAAFEESFVAYAPKFVSQAFPNYNNVSETAPDAAQLQLSMFLQEMTQRQKLPEIYSYLKLCTAVSVPKLAEFLGTDEDACITWLLALKHKTRNLRWRGGSPLSGDWVQSADVDFYISKDMTHVNEYRPPRRYGQYFIRHILKLEDTLDYMRVKAAARS